MWGCDLLREFRNVFADATIDHLMNIELKDKGIYIVPGADPGFVVRGA
jgi:hypothetical protein